MINYSLFKKVRISLFIKEWWHWGTFENRNGLHGYRFWWKIGPLQIRWGTHEEPCARCAMVYKC
jgi:hypothetical protein